MKNKKLKFSKEYQLVFILCRLAQSGIGSNGLNILLTSAKWQQADVYRKFSLLDQQYQNDFAIANDAQRKYMVQTRKRIELMLES